MFTISKPCSGGDCAGSWYSDSMSRYPYRDSTLCCLGECLEFDGGEKAHTLLSEMEAGLRQQQAVVNGVRRPWSTLRRSRAEIPH